MSETSIPSPIRTLGTFIYRVAVVALLAQLVFTQSRPVTVESVRFKTGGERLEELSRVPLVRFTNENMDVNATLSDVSSSRPLPVEISDVSSSRPLPVELVR